MYSGSGGAVDRAPLRYSRCPLPAVRSRGRRNRPRPFPSRYNSLEPSNTRNGFFERAYALSHEPSMLHNSRARVSAGDVTGAIESYRAFSLRHRTRLSAAKSRRA